MYLLTLLSNHYWHMCNLDAGRNRRISMPVETRFVILYVLQDFDPFYQVYYLFLETAFSLRISEVLLQDQ